MRIGEAHDQAAVSRHRRRPPRAYANTRLRALGAGGVAGNQQLTAITGLVLIVMLAVIGITILRIRQLISVHLFVGTLLLGPVLLKLASTGYRFTRYYTNDPVYRRKGPPDIAMRLIAPVVVLSTLVVFISGIPLMLEGPKRRDPFLLVHKASFFVWLGFTALHVLGHLSEVSSVLGRSHADESASGLSGLKLSGGRAGRSLALAGAVVGGLVLAIILIPTFGPWTSPVAFMHHH